MELGEKLRKIRINKDYSQEYIAKKIRGESKLYFKPRKWKNFSFR